MVRARFFQPPNSQPSSPPALAPPRKSLFLRSTTDLPNEPTVAPLPPLRGCVPTSLAHAAWSITSVPSADLPNEPTARERLFMFHVFMFHVFSHVPTKRTGIRNPQSPKRTHPSAFIRVHLRFQSTPHHRHHHRPP